MENKVTTRTQTKLIKPKIQITEDGKKSIERKSSINSNNSYISLKIVDNDEGANNLETSSSIILSLRNKLADQLATNELLSSSTDKLKNEIEHLIKEITTKDEIIFNLRETVDKLAHKKTHFNNTETQTELSIFKPLYPETQVHSATMLEVGYLKLLGDQKDNIIMHLHDQISTLKDHIKLLNKLTTIISTSSLNNKTDPDESSTKNENTIKPVTAVLSTTSKKHTTIHKKNSNSYQKANSSLDDHSRLNIISSEDVTQALADVQMKLNSVNENVSQGNHANKPQNKSVSSNFTTECTAAESSHLYTEKLASGSSCNISQAPLVTTKRQPNLQLSNNLGDLTHKTDASLEAVTIKADENLQSVKIKKGKSTHTNTHQMKGSGSPNCLLEAAPVNNWIWIGGLKNSTTLDNVKSYVALKFPNKLVHCYDLRCKGSRKAFKIGSADISMEEMCRPENWTPNAIIMPFQFLSRPTRGRRSA